MRFRVAFFQKTAQKRKTKTFKKEKKLKKKQLFTKQKKHTRQEKAVQNRGLNMRGVGEDYEEICLATSKVWKFQQNCRALQAQADALREELEKCGMFQTANFVEKEVLHFLFGLTFCVDIAEIEKKQGLKRLGYEA